MKKYKTLVANGCSFVIGLCLDYRPKQRFSKLLSNKLECEEYNIAKSGGSNDRIIRTSFDWVDLNRGREDVLIVFGLTGYARMDVWINEWNSYQQFIFSSRKAKTGFSRKYNLQKNLGVTVEERNKFFKIFTKYFLSEKERMEKLKRELIMFQSYMKEQLPNSELILFSSLLWDVPKSFKECFNWFEFKNGQTWIEDCGKNRKVASHPSVDAHKLIADELYDFIEKI
jgi:hypothetical protein